MTQGLDMLVVARWQEYARPRFTLGMKRERSAWRDLVRETQSLYAEFVRNARQAGRAVDYGVENLQLGVIGGLDSSCALCGTVYGLDDWAVSYVTSIDRGLGDYSLSNLVVSCKRCAQARGTLRVDVWLNILHALNG